MLEAPRAVLELFVECEAGWMDAFLFLDFGALGALGGFGVLGWGFVGGVLGLGGGFGACWRWGPWEAPKTFFCLGGGLLGPSDLAPGRFFY